jgi:hypothetical protein
MINTLKCSYLLNDALKVKFKIQEILFPREQLYHILAILLLKMISVRNSSRRFWYSDNQAGQIVSPH